MILKYYFRCIVKYYFKASCQAALAGAEQHNKSFKIIQLQNQLENKKGKG